VSALALGFVGLGQAGCSDLQATLVAASGDDGGASCTLPRPPEGVYTYSTGQSLPAEEDLTINGNVIKIEVGPNFSSSVRYEDAGYAFRTVLSDNDRETLHLSPGLSGLEIGKWEEFVYGSLESVTCVPPITWVPCAPSTAPFAVACTGTNTELDGGLNIVGTHTLASQNDAVVVAGQSIPAFHFTDHRTIQGVTQGLQDDDWWFRTTDGLPLRHIYSARVSSPSPNGPATFAVNLDYTLQSLSPSPLPLNTDGGL
jgi:hypothetical protein